jgi:hypothetical protein
MSVQFSLASRPLIGQPGEDGRWIRGHPGFHTSPILLSSPVSRFPESDELGFPGGFFSRLTDSFLSIQLGSSISSNTHQDPRDG